MEYRRVNFVDEFKQLVAEKREGPFYIFDLTMKSDPNIITNAGVFSVGPVPEGYLDDDDTPAPRRKTRKKRARRDDSLKFLNNLYALKDDRQ